MSTNGRQLRCFAEKRGQQWQAFCLELNLAVQADTLKDAEHKLHDMVRSYVKLAMEQNDAKHQRDMLFRPAPLSIQLRYVYVCLMVSLARLFAQPRRHGARRAARRRLTFSEQVGFC